MAAASARTRKPVATPLAALASRLAGFPVVTCDVFDTALFRCLARPEDVHLATGIRARAQGIIQHDPAAFQTWRQQAEHAAQQAAAAAGHDEPTMAEIYAQLVEYGVVADGAAAEALAALEFAVERQLNSANAALRTVLLARPPGQDLVFVSDTQMPASQIATLLADAGYPSPTVYSSADARLSKHSGRLFPHVLAQLSRRADEVIHLGDNPHSDIAQAAAHGIATAWLPQPGRPPEPPATARAHHLVRLAHSHRRSLAARAERPPADAEGAPDLARYASLLLLGFTLHILAEARRRGIRRVYFLARDGWLPFQLARRLAPRLAPDLTLDYLHVSRRAVAPDTHNSSTEDIAAAALELSRGQPLSRLLRFVDVDEATTAGLLEAAGLDPAARIGEGAALAEIRGFLLAQAPLIEARLAARRQAARDYLAGQGFLEPGPRMIVDVGWRGSTQEALARLAGLDEAELFGCYLGLFPQALRPALNLRNAAGYLFTFGAPQEQLDLVLDGYVLPELFFSSPEPTVLRYAEAVSPPVPVFAAEPEPGASRRRAALARLERDCLAECDALERILDGAWPAELDAASAMLDMTGLLRLPSRAEVERINDIPFLQGIEGDIDETVVTPIAARNWLIDPRGMLGYLERATWRGGAARLYLPWPLPSMTAADLQHRVQRLLRLLPFGRA